ASNYRFDANGILITDPFIGKTPLIENHAKALWQPRVGLAWDVTGSGKWAVRAGFGIHNDLQDNLANRLNANPPFSGRLTYMNRPLLSIIPVTAEVRQPSGLPCGRSSRGKPVRPAGNRVRPGGVAPEPATRHQPGLVLSRHQQLPCDESLLAQAREPRTDVQDQLHLGKGAGPQFR